MYDDGAVDEGARIAVALRTLMHDTKNSKSLFTQLGLWDSLVRSFGPRQRPSCQNWNYVAAFQLTGQPMQLRAVPRFTASAAETTFVAASAWWDTELVVGISSVPYTRRDLVLNLADKDGAHFDSTVGEDYDAINTFGGFKTRVMRPWPGCGKASGEVTSIDNTLLAGVRHIAHEMLTSETQV